MFLHLDQHPSMGKSADMVGFGEGVKADNTHQGKNQTESKKTTAETAERHNLKYSDCENKKKKKDDSL